MPCDFVIGEIWTFKYYRVATLGKKFSFPKIQLFFFLTVASSQYVCFHRYFLSKKELKRREKMQQNFNKIQKQ